MCSKKPWCLFLILIVLGGCQGAAHRVTAPPPSSNNRASILSSEDGLRKSTVGTYGPSITSTIGVRDSKKDCTWVTSYDTENGSEEDSLSFLKQRALAMARKKAMFTFLGKDVSGYDQISVHNFLGRTQQTFDSLISVSSKGLIIDEIPNFTPTSQSQGVCKGCPTVSLQDKVCLQPLPQHQFYAELTLDNDQFQEGRPIRISVETIPKVHIYLYDEDTKTRRIQLIAPNDYVPDFNSRTGKRQYPTKKLLAQGAELDAELPPGQKVSFEGILLIVTPEELAPSLYQPKTNDTEGDLLTRLRLRGVPWERDFRPFKIFTKALGRGEFMKLR